MATKAQNKFTSASSQIQNAKRSHVGNNVSSFPSNLGANKMVFTFRPYEYKAPETVGLNSISVAFGNAEVTPKASNTVIFPLPNNLQDQNEARIGRFDGGYIGTMVAKASAGFMDAASTSFKGSKDAALNAIATDTGKNLADMVFAGDKWGEILKDSANLTKFAGNTINRAVSMGTGVVANPKAAVVYEGHELKYHSFVWTFAPRSREESLNLRNILNYIKSCQLPVTGGDSEQGLYLKYPMIVDIFFDGIDESYFYQFKPCMLRSFNVNYAGQNAIAILEGGRPAVVTVEMNFMEMDIHYADEYLGHFGDTLKRDDIDKDGDGKKDPVEIPKRSERQQ